MAFLRDWLRVSYADDRQEAADDAGFFAITEEKIAAASSAQIADDNAFHAQAYIKELCSICLAKIQQNVLRRRLVAGRSHVEPLQRVRFVTSAQFVKPVRSLWELRAKLRGDLSTNLIAAAADGRADSREQIRRSGSKLHLHFADGLCDDALQCAAPTRMNRGNRTVFGVDQKNRNTVCGLNREQQPRTICRGGVAAAWCCGWSFENVRNIGVNLAECGELHGFGAKRGLKTEAVLLDVFLGIPFRKAKIQDFFAAEVAYPAEPRAESMDQPWNSTEC